MSAVEDFLHQLPVAQLAQQVGADEETTRAGAQQAVDALMQGMQANAQDPSGAASLQQALGQHAGNPVDLGAADPVEGDQIVSHIFGPNRDAVTSQLSANNPLLQRLLPMLAPLVMTYLAKRLSESGGLGGALGGALGGNQQSAPTAPTQQTPGPAQEQTQTGGGLGDLLGSILGGGATGGQGAPAGGLGSILDDLLGQGRRQ